MNQHEALALCNQIYLLDEKAVARENVQYNYVLARFTETDKQVISELYLIDPNLAESGTFSDWARLEQYQQLATLFMTHASKLAQKLGDDVTRYNGQKRPFESRETFARRMEKHVRDQRQA